MITATIHPDQRVLVVQYPDFTNLKQEVHLISSNQHAENLIRIRSVKFISNALRSYVNGREVAYFYAGSLTIPRITAIAQLRLILDTFSEGSLIRLTHRIAQAKHALNKIEPSLNSSKRINYEQKIKPVLEWCDQYAAAAYPILKK
ncbi:hypothetical protein J5U18_12650 [Sphingobacteriaceae bacterium WQ 2009]|uniref:Uncharacterized protein n=1 Tax=Rhinopithecimicrobium faecis TaxID=2820698 RepID=A0A8T4HBA8_9SPHI|nr:hypothetical protein [Sphingobacteriaceae bacterium WQ 2009]